MIGEAIVGLGMVLILIALTRWARSAPSPDPGDPFDYEDEIERLQVENNELREALRQAQPQSAYRDAPKSTSFAVEELREDLERSDGWFVTVARQDLALALSALLADEEEDPCDCPCTGKCKPWVPSQVEQDDFAEGTKERLERENPGLVFRES